MSNTDTSIKHEASKNLLEAGQLALSDAKHRIIDVKDAVVERSESMVGSTRSVIKAHPLTSIGIAFGVGYFAMRLIRR